MADVQTPQEGKRGVHPLVWVAVGCAGVLIVGAIGLVVTGLIVFNKTRDLAREVGASPVQAAARLLAAANPDIELVSVDERARLVTFRNKKTGEELVFDFKDIEEGKMSFFSDDDAVSVELDANEGGQGGLAILTDDGRARFGAGLRPEDLPTWLPVYPGTLPKGSFSTESAEERAGAYFIETTDSLEEVLEYYRSKLEAEGLAVVETSSFPLGAFLRAESPDELLTATVTLSNQEGKVQALVHFGQK